MTSISPRLVPLADARKRLGGMHPATFGIFPLGKGRGAKWDLKAIDARLDQLSGLSVDAVHGAANDQTKPIDDIAGELDELVALERKIEANAARSA